MDKFVAPDLDGDGAIIAGDKAVIACDDCDE